jgi:hypothetical protein
MSLNTQYLSFLLLLILANSTSFAQEKPDVKYNQFWNEYAFNHNLSQAWALELDIGLTSSSIPSDNNPFYGITQFYVRGWAHYYPDDRWKLSVYYAYFYNRNVPELSQRKAPEYRSAIQGTYYILRGRNKLSTRFRIEDRHLQNEDGFFEAVNRFRIQAKYVYPFTGPAITKDVLYGFTSDELFFKTKSEISGPDNFDRNRFTIGLGYVLTDAIQLEISYANETLPRDNRTEIINAVQLNVVFTDFLSSIKKAPEREKKAIEDSN